MISAPKLSVCLLTYNHEKFIAQAIESVIDQRTDFPIEIIIADDYSTDNTRNIIKSYAQKYPGLIRLVLQKENVGHSRNFYDLISQASGEYIANLDGDDYWTNPFKLQRQVDFLDAHEDYVGCAHNVQMDHEKKAPEFVNGENTLDTVTIKDYAKGNAYFHASCMVYRNVYKSKLPEIVLDERCGCGDWFFGLLNLQCGNIKYINEVMSVYRIHPKGLWSALSPIKQKLKNAENALFYRSVFSPKFSSDFSKAIYRNCLSAIGMLKSQKGKHNWFLIAKYSLLRDFADLQNNHPLAKVKRALSGVGFNLVNASENALSQLFSVRQTKRV